MAVASMLTPEVIGEYEANGAVYLRGVFDSRWIETVKEGIKKNREYPSCHSESLKGETGPGAYFDDYCNWMKIEEFKDFAFHSPAAEIAGRLTRSKYIAFYHEHVLVKEPGTHKRTPWHHDQSYYPIDGFKVCSIWMPVDPVPKDTCVQFVAGSHKWDWYYPRKFSTNLPYEMQDPGKIDRVYKPVPDIDQNLNQYNILHWDVQPGDCIVFHMRTIHGAPSNESMERSRRVLATRWLGDDAKVAIRPWEVSPPTFGGLVPGNPAISEEFPLVWSE